MQKIADSSLKVPDHLEPFESHKKEAMKSNLAKRYQATNDKKAVRCAICGNLLVFESYQHHKTQELRHELISANFCKVRWCPMCAWLKCKKLISELSSVFAQIEANHKVRYLLLTLTIQNTTLENLRASVDHMSKAYKLLIKTEQWKKSIWGYLRALEFLGDETPSDQAHPHYHCLLVVPSSYFDSRAQYITQSTYVKLWQKCLKSDYRPIVDIRKIESKEPKERNENVKQEISEALLSALLECVKYIAKPSQVAKLSQAQFETLDAQSRHVRQYNKGGLLKQYKPLDDHDLSPDEWKKLETEFYRWCGLEYKLLDRH